MTTALFFKILMWLAQLAGVIFAIIYWKYYKNTNQRYFLQLIILIFLSEILSTTLKEVYGIPNYFIYNILSFVTQLFYLIWFYKISDEKFILKVGILIYGLSVIYCLIFNSFLGGLYKMMWYTGAILILFNAIFYFNKILKKDEIIYYQKNQVFWIVTGLLIYHLGYLPLLFFIDVELFKSNTLYYRIPVLLLNLVLYGCFIKSFLCSKTQKT